MIFYKKHYPEIEDPMLVEAFLFQLGGCDFHDKPFSRKKRGQSIGYDIIADEFIQEFFKYKNMLPTMVLNVEVNGLPTSVSAETVQVDWVLYDTFAKNVYKRKNKKKKTPLVDPDTTKMRMVIPRQIMFTMMCIRNIPKIRAETGHSIMFDPYGMDGYWGYVKTPLPNRPEHFVCTSAKEVPLVKY